MQISSNEPLADKKSHKTLIITIVVLIIFFLLGFIYFNKIFVKQYSSNESFSGTVEYINQTGTGDFADVVKEPEEIPEVGGFEYTFLPLDEQFLSTDKTIILYRYQIKNIGATKQDFPLNKIAIHRKGVLQEEARVKIFKAANFKGKPIFEQVFSLSASTRESDIIIPFDPSIILNRNQKLFVQVESNVLAHEDFASIQTVGKNLETVKIMTPPISVPAELVLDIETHPVTRGTEHIRVYAKGFPTNELVDSWTLDVACEEGLILYYKTDKENICGTSINIDVSYFRNRYVLRGDFPLLSTPITYSDYTSRKNITFTLTANGKYGNFGSHSSTITTYNTNAFYVDHVIGTQTKQKNKIAIGETARILGENFFRERYLISLVGASSSISIPAFTDGINALNFVLPTSTEPMNYDLYVVHSSTIKTKPIKIDVVYPKNNLIKIIPKVSLYQGGNDSGGSYDMRALFLTGGTNGNKVKKWVVNTKCPEGKRVMLHQKSVDLCQQEYTISDKNHPQGSAMILLKIYSTYGRGGDLEMNIKAYGDNDILLDEIDWWLSLDKG